MHIVFHLNVCCTERTKILCGRVFLIDPPEVRIQGLAKNPGSESGKFYAEAPDTPDEKIAQYVLLFEHPSQVTASEEQPGRYWKNYKEK